MKKSIRITAIYLIIIFVAVSLIGCASLKKSSGSSSSSGSVSSSEPLTGNWSMSRVSIEPELPSAVPDFIVDQVIPKSSTWKISSSGSQLKITYGGRSTWFNPMGIDINGKSTSASEGDDKKSCVFTGGGSVDIEKLPAVMSFIGDVRNISAGYSDEVGVTLTSQDKISAVITFDATGSYVSSDASKSFSYHGTITYSGKRK
ncbi:MAG: hypothetical protein PHO26_03180 [Dehalococcoidia bacterium]|nr:hypothetical protein [Dehalococcoidia bacterium]MDD5495113.1 hypothetical protein [Dehalococcoidia bacterium]